MRPPTGKSRPFTSTRVRSLCTVRPASLCPERYTSTSTTARVQTLAPSSVRALATSVQFEHRGGTAVDVTELAWREADRPALTHQSSFAPAVAAAIAPVSARNASDSYQARYDEEGFLRATARNEARPFTGRAAQIQAMAERLLGGRTARARTTPPPPVPTQRAQPLPPTHEQRPPTPGRRP